VYKNIKIGSFLTE